MSYDVDHLLPRRRPNRFWVVFVASLALLVAALWLTTGCTVAPKYVEVPTAASFDGNVQNSGFVGFNQDGSGVITPRARDRYNALVKLYGKDFAPRLRKDDGVTKRDDGNFNITAKALTDFAVMNRKFKSGIAPK